MGESLKMNSLSIGVDIGGTFTDVVVYDEQNHSLHSVKTPTIHSNLTMGILEGLLKAAVEATSISRFTHGTTIATNILLENKGAP